MMPSYEFVKKWFEKAAQEAKRQGRKDASALWEDGLAQLTAMRTENAPLRSLVRELAELHRVGALPNSYAVKEILSRPEVKRIMEEI